MTSNEEIGVRPFSFSIMGYEVYRENIIFLIVGEQDRTKMARGECNKRVIVDPRIATFRVMFLI